MDKHAGFTRKPAVNTRLPDLLIVFAGYASRHCSVFLALLMVATPPGQAGAAEYAGRETCAQCHAQEHRQWTGSHHDLAMQIATEDSVLGNFDSVEFRGEQGITTFFRDGKRFMIRTDGADGTLKDYEVRYVFGVDPLQQYLIPLENGRLQAFTVAWDTRPKSAGGQRWFQLYPGEKITYRDRLHWTGSAFNWNGMCAECHSTALQRNYDAEKDSFSTRWSEINVSCEACHGPASDHLKWARKQEGWEAFNPTRGLGIQFDERDNVQWIPPGNGRGTAKRNVVNSSRREIGVCAPCHSRRSRISDGYLPGENFNDHYLPRLLDPGMYHPDGQIEEEVYVYGSFIQSRMYQAGVTCSDCHNPHSLKLRAPGKAVCLQCHTAERFDTPQHHFHKMDGTGADCIECHMPATTYMVVDPRHDHSFRIPRPDQSQPLHTPNACNRCHSDQTAGWAAAQVAKWYPERSPGLQSFGPVLHAARARNAGADVQLREIIESSVTPTIAVATAVSLLHAYLSPQNLDLVQSALRHPDPLVRQAAVSVLEFTPPEVRVPLAFPLLNDSSRIVRIEAARILGSIPSGELAAERKTMLENAKREYRTSQEINADRPEAQLNLGNHYLAAGDLKKAESGFSAAIRLDPTFAAAYINLADTYRLQNAHSESSRVLYQGLERTQDQAEIYHALGMALVRQQKTPEAVDALARAAELAPANPRFTYVYAIALNSAGKSEKALDILQKAHQKFPQERDILQALVALNRDADNTFAARLYLNKLQNLDRQGAGAGPPSSR